MHPSIDATDHQEQNATTHLRGLDPLGRLPPGVLHGRRVVDQHVQRLAGLGEVGGEALDLAEGGQVHDVQVHVLVAGGRLHTVWGGRGYKQASKKGR